MFIADKKFVLLVAVLLLIGQLSWNSVFLKQPDKFWWVDMLLHFLGGVMVASIFFILAEKKFPLIELPVGYLAGVLAVVSFVVLIGVFWEFYEYLLDYFLYVHQMELPDTLSDLFFDFLGGTLASTVYLRYSRVSL
jgi:uncharacterized membrane protein YagU involved in acid resistance